MTDIREHPVEGSPSKRRWAFLVTPGWIAVILAVVAFAGACFFVLAPWQFNRNTDRTAQNNAVDAAITATAVPVTNLLSSTAEPATDLSWRVVTATGEFDPSRQVQVRLRQDASGSPVSEVITPFRLTTGEMLLVDRGYVSFSDVHSGVPIPDPPAGQVTLTGRLQQDQVDPANRVPVHLDGRTEAYAINVAAIGGPGESETFLRGYIQLAPNSPGVLTPIEVPQTDSGPFLSYALQWEAFGIIALIGLGVFIYREVADPRPADDHLDSPAPTGPGDRLVASRDSTGRSAPAGGEPGGPVRRRSRDGFDRSQLYDDN